MALHGKLTRGSQISYVEGLGEETRTRRTLVPSPKVVTTLDEDNNANVNHANDFRNCSTFQDCPTGNKKAREELKRLSHEEDSLKMSVFGTKGYPEC